MQIRLLKTRKILGTWPLVTYHKGRIYQAAPATNQPNCDGKGKIFAWKKTKNELEILLEKGEYEVIKEN